MAKSQLPKGRTVSGGSHREPTDDRAWIEAATRFFVGMKIASEIAHTADRRADVLRHRIEVRAEDLEFKLMEAAGFRRVRGR